MHWQLKRFHTVNARAILFAGCLLPLSLAHANQVAQSQQRYLSVYKQQTQKVAPQSALINTEAEPDLSEGFTSLYNGNNLDGWTPRGGTCRFEASGESIMGTCVKGSPSTYLSTDREDYTDFIFTAEVKWLVDGNSGIMFRAQRKPGKRFETVFGPQCEMEGFAKGRGWSGGIFGQSAGGWRYPLWLDAHEQARAALKQGAWNRVTIKAVGKNVKTWVNGIPAANWDTDEYFKGFFGLQVHSGKKGSIYFRNIKVKELHSSAPFTDLFAGGDFSSWTDLKGRPVAHGWSIEQGVVHRSGERPGDIITQRHYKHFELRFDWKISVAGNSGVKYRTKGKLGLEYQILDDARHHDRKNPTHRAGALYEICAAPDDKPLKAAGEWNRSRIFVEGNSIQHWLNGHQVVAIEYGSDDWQKRFQTSKYRKHAGFGSWSGPILLQDHKDEVWYRNVQIRELSAPE